MSSQGPEALGEAIVSVIMTVVMLAFAALRVLIPLVGKLALLAIVGQRAAIDMLFERAAPLLGLQAPPTGTFRFALTTGLYAVVLGPAAALVVLGATHDRALFIGVLVGALLGLVVAIAALLPHDGDDPTVLASLRFWD